MDRLKILKNQCEKILKKRQIKLDPKIQDEIIGIMITMYINGSRDAYDNMYKSCEFMVNGLDKDLETAAILYNLR